MATIDYDYIFGILADEILKPDNIRDLKSCTETMMHLEDIAFKKSEDSDEYTPEQLMIQDTFYEKWMDIIVREATGFINESPYEDVKRWVGAYTNYIRRRSKLIS